MAVVQGVQGPIDADHLGLTLIHEHFFASDEAVMAQWPHLRDREAERRFAIESAEAVMRHGVKTVADPTVMLLGREVRALEELAAETGLQIVASTGVYTYDALPQYLLNRDADFIADLFVHDIEEGIQGTAIRAAFLKCAADEAGVNERVEKIHRAVARASVKTGAPIMAHSRPASATGPRQVEVLLEEGVEPHRIQIAHTGDTDDLDYIEQLLDQGVYVGMDRYGLELFLPIERRNATVVELLKLGYVDQVLLSHDFDIQMAAGFGWFPSAVLEQLEAAGAAKGWSMTLIFEEVLPALRDAGVTDEQIEVMMVENPRRWLAGG